ncbi:MAG: iron-sulfur cluster assembly protein, partial [Gammaproteobacteria bacterium]|nr:iron-sulfur cluster assembly protein [Gammaproteobacteria bacterium]
MKNLTPNDITKQLATYIIPELGCDLVTAKAVRDIVAIADHVQVNIQLSYPLELVKAQLEQNISDYLRQQLELQQIVVKVSWKVPEVKITSGLRGLAQIKNIIAVA